MTRFQHRRKTWCMVLSQLRIWSITTGNSLPLRSWKITATTGARNGRKDATLFSRTLQKGWSRVQPGPCCRKVGRPISTAPTMEPGTQLLSLPALISFMQTNLYKVFLKLGMGNTSLLSLFPFLLVHQMEIRGALWHMSSACTSLLGKFPLMTSSLTVSIHENPTEIDGWQIQL